MRRKYVKKKTLKPGDLVMINVGLMYGRFAQVHSVPFGSKIKIQLFDIIGKLKKPRGPWHQDELRKTPWRIGMAARILTGGFKGYNCRIAAFTDKGLLVKIHDKNDRFAKFLKHKRYFKSSQLQRLESKPTPGITYTDDELRGFEHRHDVPKNEQIRWLKLLKEDNEKENTLNKHRKK